MKSMECGPALRGPVTGMLMLFSLAAQGGPADFHQRLPPGGLDELQIGRRMAVYIFARHELDSGPAAKERLERIGQELAAHGAMEGPFHFSVLKEDRVVSYSAPGGFIFISRGALGMLDDQGVAALVAHEMAHLQVGHALKELEWEGRSPSHRAALRESNAGNDSNITLAQVIGAPTAPARAAITALLPRENIDGIARAAADRLMEARLPLHFEHEANLSASQIMKDSGYDSATLDRLTIQFHSDNE